jgi:hypothetical protein
LERTISDVEGLTAYTSAPKELGAKESFEAFKVIPVPNSRVQRTFETENVLINGLPIAIACLAPQANEHVNSEQNAFSQHSFINLHSQS